MAVNPPTIPIVAVMSTQNRTSLETSSPPTDDVRRRSNTRHGASALKVTCDSCTALIRRKRESANPTPATRNTGRMLETKIETSVIPGSLGDANGDQTPHHHPWCRRCLRCRPARVSKSLHLLASRISPAATRYAPRVRVILRRREWPFDWPPTAASRRGGSDRSPFGFVFKCSRLSQKSTIVRQAARTAVVGDAGPSTVPGTARRGHSGPPKLTT